MQNKKMLPLTDRRALVVYLQEMRYRRIAFQTPIYVYKLDGLDDFLTLANRGINVEQDIDIEWEQRSVTADRDQIVISQNVLLSESSREFSIELTDTNKFRVVIGGSVWTLGDSLNMAQNGRYRITLIGTALTLFINDTQVQQVTFTRGASREPTAVTKIGVRSNGTVGSNVGFLQGILFNVRINGTLWPIGDRNKTIQLPMPSGLGSELITPTVLENPAIKGTQWTYLGEGRWQLIGDGSYNNLTFILVNNIPSQGYFEFEIESITGDLRCSADAVNVIGNRSNITTGIKRVYYLTKPNDFTFVRNGTSVVSCIIKNISFKPLGTCNPMTGTNLNSDRWTEIPA